MRSKLTYPHVTSTVALFLAIGGSAYAVSELSKNEVKSKHIGPRQVKNSDLGGNAVTSAKVADGSLLPSDFAAVPAGQQGPQGIQGPAGPTASAAAHTNASVTLSDNGETVLDLDTVNEQAGSQQIVTTFNSRIVVTGWLGLVNENSYGATPTAQEILDATVRVGCQPRIASSADPSSFTMMGNANGFLDVHAVDNGGTTRSLYPIAASIVRPPGTYNVKVACRAGESAPVIRFVGGEIAVVAAASS